jgi:nitrile hydratase beta subunit
MDGIHDLGGKHGYGKVERQADAPTFAAIWEAKVFAIMKAAGAAGAWKNSDQFRHFVEKIEPAAYLSQGYYGRWLGGAETAFVEAGLIESEQLNARVEKLGGNRNDLIAARPQPGSQAASTQTTVARLANTAQRDAGEGLFSIGDMVLTSSEVKPGHTRLPAYARNKFGEIVAIHGGWIYPDSNAHGLGEQPTQLYTVKFASSELWGETSQYAEENVSVFLDLFEPYLQTCPATER